MGGPCEDNPPFCGRWMESQSLVNSERILSIYSRGAQRGKVTCPESHSKTQIKARTQDSQPSAHPTTSHIPLPVNSVCTEISQSPRPILFSLSPEGHQGVTEGSGGGKLQLTIPCPRPASQARVWR